MGAFFGSGRFSICRKFVGLCRHPCILYTPSRVETILGNAACDQGVHSYARCNGFRHCVLGGDCEVSTNCGEGMVSDVGWTRVSWMGRGLGASKYTRTKSIDFRHHSRWKPHQTLPVMHQVNFTLAFLWLRIASDTSFVRLETFCNGSCNAS